MTDHTGPGKGVNQRYDDEALFTMLREVASEVDRTPGRATFDRRMGWNISQTLINRFGSYVRACELAGLEPNHQTHPVPRTYDDAAVHDAFLRVYGIYDRTPSISEWEKARRGGEPSSIMLRNRFGGWPEFLSVMIALSPQLELGPEPSLEGRAENGVVA